MKKRKPISQHKAMRLRKENNQLKKFIRALRDEYHYGLGVKVADFQISDFVAGGLHVAYGFDKRLIAKRVYENGHYALRVSVITLPEINE